ncbi:hypothetical protein V497_01138 [Pseudogymnoascus sp. VKM F-4516 (FW-969)]|nr:hypothetical protein V497_01138 [Pseudogymnoascus sp. VKM F-4516 (FW-969)]
MAITCIYQLGSFISQAGTCEFAEKAGALGLCTGALAAAAVSCSGNILDLVPLSVDAVTAAFRTGMLVADMATRVSPGKVGDSWSIIVSGSTSTEALNKFCEQTPLPLTSRPYVSVYTQNGTTVSGKPEVLEKLLSCESFQGLRNTKIPIYGPYHAPHLYSQHDITAIVEGLASVKYAMYQERIPVLSSTGAKVERRNFAGLLRAAVEQILLQPIRWSNIIEDVQTCIQAVNPQAFTVVPFGTCADQIIYSTIKETPLGSLINAVRTSRKPSDSPSTPYPNPKKPKLAIIGMSGRYPGAKDNDAFWNVLHQGLDMHKTVPEMHWDAKTHFDPTGTKKNTSATEFGCWLDDPDLFDARFFNISPREAPQIDPAQRLALMTSFEAIEQAGIVPDATPSTRRDRVGVLYGVTSNDWMETNSAQNIDTYFIPGGNRAFIPGRINYFFKFSGPSYAVDTACSSSLAAIHLACNSLWRGDIDTAIAGGTNVLTNPDFTAGLDRGHFLSRTGNCKTFDDSADGYCRGEGVGTVIIKRLDDALADNDPILGVILGAYTNHSAESESITRPHVGAQRAIFNKILNQAGVDPYTVGYVEMHGTGTQAGDAGEMLSVLDTFAPPLSEVKRGRNADEALYIGSAKANIGHGEAASGVSSLIKVLLMMKKNIIVPHCGIKTRINRKFPTDLQERNVNIAFKPTAWDMSTGPNKPRRAFVNNFSAAGGNSALLIEDAPERPEISRDATDPRSHHLIAVSAKSGVSIQGNLSTMLRFLKENPDVSLAELSYTTTARRIHNQHRVLLCGSNVKSLCNQIETSLQNKAGVTRAKNTPKVVFAFTGQGAQYPGMGRQLFESFSVFRTEMNRLDHITQSLGFPSVLPLIQSEEQDIDIFEPLVVQLASVCMQIATSKLWAAWNITPTTVVGHSLGEYAALNVAGVLSDADAIYLVGTRATLLQQKCTRNTHAMLVVKASVDEIAQTLPNGSYEISCINSSSETVLAGKIEGITRLKDLLAEAGTKSIFMKVPYAFHSSQIEPLLSDFTIAASCVSYLEPNIPVLCPLDGNVVEEHGNFNAEYLARHARESVNMRKALAAGHKQRLISDQTVVLEVGPHPAVSGMVRAEFSQQVTTLATLQRGRDMWPVLGASLQWLYVSGASINWTEYHRDFKGSHKVLSLPSYSWDLKPFWMQYVNDWSLRKGDPPMVINSALSLESTTIHRIVKETGDSQKTYIVVEADITREDLSPLVQGHEVDGIPLCTPSVYADIALSLGSYLLKRYQPAQKESLVDVSDMTVSKALILQPNVTQQLLQAHSDIDWSNNCASTKFMSFDSKQKLQEHARCVLRFKSHELQGILQADAANVKKKMQALRDGIALETSARFNRPMVYRAIRPLARFHDDYRAIDEVVLNSTTLEASSQLSFGSVKRAGNFHTHPAIIDSLTQSCGFTMNCNDSSDLDTEVFMNHGWGSLQIFEPMDFEKKYTTYTRMSQGPDKLWHGDVVIFNDDKVVAFFSQIAIQGVPRRVLKVILSLESGRKTQKQQLAQTTSQPAVEAKPTASNLHTSSPNNQGPQAAKLNMALTIIAEESGLAVSDLSDTTVFSEVGIDSLLGLTISTRFREELDLDLEFNAMFYDYPTVGDLKLFFGDAEPSGTPISSSSTSFDDTASPTSTAGATTPSNGEGAGCELDFQSVLAIISEESGIAMEELAEDTNFADSGVDSLLSLVIVSRLRDELEFDIQHESLLLECPTVGDLRRLLLGDVLSGNPVKFDLPIEPEVPEGTKTQGGASTTVDESPVRTEKEILALDTRKQAVDELVQKYTASFAVSGPSQKSITASENETVVLVTGASGSLGSHLVYHFAQLPDVKRVVCLNRENKVDPYLRQRKAMRDKGIRFPEALENKLLVLQTDITKPMLGLPSDVYKILTTSVTHLIHNAWPMSAKRDLAGFEPQFQSMRNLIDFGCHVISCRSSSFKFSFQMVSSIGVVGHYGLGTGETRTMVPEDRMSIDAVLPNGYGEAKWGCERMLDETLHKHASHFRSMVVRLGQIAGSKTSGYWNPMEHFGFLLKSSQTLNALPDVDGDVFWTPVNDIAEIMSDLILSNRTPHHIYHIENPVGQTWKEINAILSNALNIPNLIPFTEWLERVRAAPHRKNPAATLLEFLESNYLRMSCGGLILDTHHTLQHSKTLSAIGPVSEEVVRKYIHIWKEIGFLD